MSDYSEVWEEMHEDQIKMEHNADKCKSVLNLSYNKTGLNFRPVIYLSHPLVSN